LVWVIALVTCSLSRAQVSFDQATAFSSGSTSFPTGNTLTLNWKIVAYDGASTYQLLDSGSFVATSNGDGTQGYPATTLTGTTSFNPVSAATSAGGWIGFFIQATSPTWVGGQHVNTGLTLNISAAAIPEPAVFAPVLGGLALVAGLRRQRSVRVKA
jgi:hypothetical protein